MDSELDLAKIVALQREINIRKARENLWAYCCIVSPDFYKGDRWHLWLICETLQALYERRLTKGLFWSICHSQNVPSWYADTVNWDRLADGIVYTKLMINMPPRHGKSRTLVNFCDWILGEDKHNKIITVSYNTDAATDQNRYVRDGIMMKKNLPTDIVYSDIFPASKIAKGNSSFMKWSLEGCFFNYLGAGLEGTLTGRGGNCLVSGTLITTDIGEIPIEQMSSCFENVNVLSYDIERKKLSYQRVIAFKESYGNEVIEITTEKGKKIVCTPEHRIYAGNGTYKNAEDFRRGENVFTFEKQEKQVVRNMWKGKRRKRTDVLGLLPKNKNTKYSLELQKMWKRVCKNKVGIRKIYKKRSERFLLLERVFKCRPCNKKQQILSCLRETFGKASEKILLRGMQDEGLYKSKESTQYNLSCLQKRISSSKQQSSLLFEKMFWNSSLGKDEGKRKFKLQRRKQLFKALSRNEKTNLRKRQLYLCYVWENKFIHRVYKKRVYSQKNRFENASSRWCCGEQHARKYGDVMQNVPPTYPQVKTDTIKKIRRYFTEKQPVYDIQVEKTHNMFAGKILLSNCTIIDDPLKSAEDSYNDRVLEGLWNWYTGTFMSRAEKEGDGSIDIINHTRWNTKDLCGRVMSSKMGESWLQLSIPVEHKGNLLCPSILPRKDFEELRDNMDPNIFRANYYQEPIDIKGRLFEQILTYDELPPNIEKFIAYIDTADEGTDYLACIMGGVKEGRGYITDIYFTQDSMAITEPETARRLVVNKINDAKIESNNGGKGFARNVERLIWETYKTRQVNISWFHQTENKMARILTGATFVMKNIFLPSDWAKRWPEFYLSIMSFQKSGGNKHDDGVEALVEWGKMITGDGSINSYIEMMKKMKEGR